MRDWRPMRRGTCARGQMSAMRGSTSECGEDDPSRGPPVPHRHFAATRAPRTWRDLPDVRRRRRTVKVVLLRQPPSLEVHTTVLEQAVLARAASTC